MVEPITAIYAQEDDEWAIIVAGLGKKVTAKAAGIIAARDRVDQLVEQLVPEGKATVVHLLNGSALEFTTAYMTARLTKPEAPAAPVVEEESAERAETAESEPDSKPDAEGKKDTKAPAGQDEAKASAEEKAPEAVEAAPKAEEPAKAEAKAEQTTDKAKLDSLASNGKFAGVSALGGQPASQLSAPSGSVTMTETATPPAARA